jgi:hypothetical protein
MSRKEVPSEAFFLRVTVDLLGGPTPNSGNVFATNPASGTYGPVCDDGWDQSDVSHRPVGYSRRFRGTFLTFTPGPRGEIHP